MTDLMDHTGRRIPDPPDRSKPARIPGSVTTIGEDVVIHPRPGPGGRRPKPSTPPRQPAQQVKTSHWSARDIQSGGSGRRRGGAGYR